MNRMAALLMTCALFSPVFAQGTTTTPPASGASDKANPEPAKAKKPKRVNKPKKEKEKATKVAPPATTP